MLAREPSEENVRSPPVDVFHLMTSILFNESGQHFLASFCMVLCMMSHCFFEMEMSLTQTWKLSDFMLESCSCYQSQVLGTQHSYGSTWQNDHPMTVQVVVWWEIMDCTSCTCVLQVWRAGRTASAAGAKQASPADAGTGRWGEIASASHWRSCFGRIFLLGLGNVISYTSVFINKLVMLSVTFLLIRCSLKAVLK